MRILIIGNGVGHNVQRIQAVDDDATQRVLKSEFEDLVKRRITEHGVQFIGEEAKFGVRTIAQSLGPRRENIDMPVVEREARGIAEEQRDRPCEPRYIGGDARTQLTEEGYQKDVGNGWVQIEHRVPSDEAREQYMFDRVMQETRGAESVIVICGILHCGPLADRFRRNTSNVVEVEFWEPIRRR